ncbi:hypothetical protein RJ639_018769 [Escallonia herrerae]|uniref:Uncharacterized protein n=1 Tax=Escallonia herrerae TaxID=1293975 RepID=A0AA89AIM7_9ASTE|nr:hypothetical protein RJ639_018769 [Escallonia herrerae]
MHPQLYNAAAEGRVDDLLEFGDQLELQLTPNKNTVLHIAATFGHRRSVNCVLANRPSLLCRENVKGNTALHLSAREGHCKVVQALIESARSRLPDQVLGKGIGAVREMLRMVNGDGDTALHEAVQYRHLDVARVLIEEDPDFSHPPNTSQETPLYLAAEKGLDECVLGILNTCRAPSYGGPGGRTALHAAVIFDSEDALGSICCSKTLGHMFHLHSHEALGVSIVLATSRSTRELLNWSGGRLSKVADKHGWTPIHYAARLGHEKRVNQICLSDERSKEMGYLTADGDEKKTALHLAASHGHVDVMMFLVACYPDCAEMVTSRGQNILHIAVKDEQEEVIKFVLQHSSLSSLINQKDNDGNTPLHLLAASTNIFPWRLVNHPRIEKMTFNKENLTPLDIAYSDKYGFTTDIIRKKLKKASARGQRDLISRNNIAQRKETPLSMERKSISKEE